MVNNNNEQKKTSNVENLVKLKEVVAKDSANQTIISIRKAKEILANLSRNISTRLDGFESSDTVVKEVKPVKEETVIQPQVSTVEKPSTPIRRQGGVFVGKVANTDTSQYKDKSYNRDGFNNRNAFNRENNNQGYRNNQNRTFDRSFNNNYQNGYQRNNYDNNQFQNRQANNQNSRFNRPMADGQRPQFNKNPRPQGQFQNTRPMVNRTKPVISRPAELDVNINTKTQDRTFGNKKKTHEQPIERKTLNKKAQMKMGLMMDDDDYERMGRRLKNPKKKDEQKQTQVTVIDRAVITSDNLTVKMLSEKIGKPVTEIIKKLFILGIMATINSNIDFDTADLVAGELGVTLEKKIAETAEQKLQTELDKSAEKDVKNLVTRPPVVTVMGHVDHGKTSLLDAIRKTNVIGGEAGGITQHIGAYMVTVKGEKITFIDTPGHAAFTAMRARGAQLTDIAILVVAADDGIMPQTIEAIDHIKSANVPMIVAINKIDAPGANPDRILQQLADHDILPEEWGGDTICVRIAAKLGQNIDKLLENVLLVAEMQELKANPNRSAVGTIIEAKLDKGKGPVATVLVQNGTLKVGDTVVSGTAFGRIRAMQDENGESIKKAGPSTPVAILGFDEVPSAGDPLTVVDEKMTKSLIQERKNKIKQDKIKSETAVSLDDFFNKVKEGSMKTLNVIVKADVQGSAEALKQSLVKIQNEEVKVVVIHAGVGAVIESDVLLAQASSAIIVGFNVKPEAKAKAVAEKAGIEIKNYRVIYECIEELTAAIKGMKAPKFVDKVIGHAEVKVLYKISSVGTIAGSIVIDGKMVRGAMVKLIRDKAIIAETTIETLKMQKDNVKEVKENYECGIKLAGFNDIKEGDIIEALISEQIKD